MTLRDMIQEVWEALGEPTDLDPYAGGVVDLSASERLRGALNNGQRAVAHWKDPTTGRQMKFQELFGDGYFRNKVVEADVASQADGGTTEYLDLSVSTADSGRFDGWVLSLGSEDYHIAKTMITGGLARVYPTKAFTSAGTTYEADTAYLRKPFSFLFPAGSTHAWTGDHVVLPAGDRNLHQGDSLEVLRVWDMTNEAELSPAPRGERYVLDSDQLGDPGCWFRFSGKLYFDKTPREQDWYRYEYYRDPQDMTALTDAPEIPEMFHWAIVLWAIEWGYRRSGESAEKYSNKRDFQDFMRTTKGVWDIRFAQSQPGGTADLRR